MNRTLAASLRVTLALSSTLAPMASTGLVHAQAVGTVQPGDVGEEDEGRIQPVDARDAEARTAYEAAAEAFAIGRFEEALTQFQQAYELSPRPQLLFNIGTTQDRLQHTEPALLAFESYLAQVPNAENRASVLARVDALRAAVERQHEAARSLQAERERQIESDRQTQAEAERQAARDREVARSLREATAAEARPSTQRDASRRRRRRWIGALIGVVALGAAAAVVGLVVLPGSKRSYQQGDFGVQLTLTEAP